MSYIVYHVSYLTSELLLYRNCVGEAGGGVLGFYKKIFLESHLHYSTHADPTSAAGSLCCTVKIFFSCACPSRRLRCNVHVDTIIGQLAVLTELELNYDYSCSTSWGGSQESSTSAGQRTPAFCLVSSGLSWKSSQNWGCCAINEPMYRRRRRSAALWILSQRVGYL